MELNKNVPAIRFNAFEDEWNEMSFGNIAQVRRGLTYSPKDIRKNGVKVLRSSNINEDRFCENNDDVYVDGSAINIDFAKNNDILITAANGSSRLVGKHALINTTHDKVVHGGFMLLASSEYPFFLNASMSSEWYRKFIFKNISGGNGAIGNLNKNHLESEVILIPKETEQTQIGNFFKTLDEQINLLDQKHQKLVNLKKAMLEKMFPKEGAYVPEIRFKGFTEKWKHIELCEVLNQRKVIQKISIDAPILAFAAGQGVIDRSERKSNNRDHLTKDESNKKYLLTELNDIVYNPSNLKYGAIDRNKHGKGVISPIYVTFTTEEFPSFIELIVKDENFKIKALQYEEGTVVKRQSVKPENLLSLKVFVSNSLEEQEKIGEYFEKLDNLIQKRQVQIGKYKNIKQALLQKMFV